MVFEFEHVCARPAAATASGTTRRCDLPDLKRSLRDAGRTGLADAAGTPSTGTTTTSRAPCPGSATTASTGSPRPRPSPPSCTCTGGRRSSTRARSSGMTNPRFTSMADYRDLESLNHYAEAVARGPVAGGGARGAAADEPGQRPHPRAVGRHGRTRGFTTGTPWIGVDADDADGQRRGPARRPRLRARPLPPAHPAAARVARRGARRLRAAAARRPAGLGLHPAVRGHRAARRREHVRGRRRPRAGRLGRRESCCWAPCREPGPELRAWESRVLRRPIRA